MNNILLSTTAQYVNIFSCAFYKLKLIVSCLIEKTNIYFLNVIVILSFDLNMYRPRHEKLYYIVNEVEDLDDIVSA
jgi:hypothetical protein